MTTDNKNLKFKGNPVTTSSEPPKVGDKAPDFSLTGLDMGEITLDKFRNKALVISCVPSIDTPVCSIQTNRFAREAQKLSSEAEILTVSLDLPFAQKRWCGANGDLKINIASDYKTREFAGNYGLFVKELGLLARAVFVLDKEHVIRYIQFVPEITDEPDYDGALKALASVVE